MLNPKADDQMNHIFGVFFNHSMTGAVRNLIYEMQRVSIMECNNILQPGCSSSYSFSQDTPVQRYKAALWMFMRLAKNTCVCLEKAFDRQLYSIIGFWACAGMESKIFIHRDNAESNNADDYIIVATEEALASAAIAQLVTKELKVKYCEHNLSEFLTTPLKELFGDEQIAKEVIMFRKATPVPINPSWTILHNGKQCSCVLCPGQNQKYTKCLACYLMCTAAPLVRWGKLASLVENASLSAETTGRLEATFSNSSGKIKAGMRNANPRTTSNIIRRQSLITTRIHQTVRSDEFVNQFTKARNFENLHLRSIEAVYNGDPKTSELKKEAYMLKGIPVYLQNGLKKGARVKAIESNDASGAVGDGDKGSNDEEEMDLYDEEEFDFDVPCEEQDKFNNRNQFNFDHQPHVLPDVCMDKVEHISPNLSFGHSETPCDMHQVSDLKDSLTDQQHSSETRSILEQQTLQVMCGEGGIMTDEDASSSVISSVLPESCFRNPLCLQNIMSKEEMSKNTMLLVAHYCALEKFSEWRDTNVSVMTNKGKTIDKAILTRSDGLKINLFPNSGCVFYVMNGDDGLELCSITNVWRQDPTSKVMFTFWHVMSSEHALEVCQHEDDLPGNQITAKRQESEDVG